MKPEILDKVREMIKARKLGGRSAIGADLAWSCDETPPALFYTGLEQFNRGEYFEQHESLEEIWILETRPIRYLYQGILRIGVGFYKLRLNNYRGTVNHINGGIAYLQPFGDECMGVDLARLISDAARVRDRVLELGPDRLSEFDLSTLPTIHYTLP
jgi:predicted metal-dependent hydrolase